MELSVTALKELHALAISAAINAGKVLSAYDRSKLKVEIKSGASSVASEVVTEVDRLCQDSILNSLKPTFSSYNLAVLTEETQDDKSRFEKDYFWCIDPIDGTLPFIENRPGYSIVISLVSQKGEALIGVVFDPVEEKVYSGIKGNGAFINNKKWEISKETAKTMAFVFDRSFSTDPRRSDVLNRLKEFSHHSGYSGIEQIQAGGAAMNAIWLANYAHGCYFKFPKDKGGSIWDYAASNCIYQELGIPVSDIFGNSMELNRAESTFMNHKGILYATESKISEFVIEMAKDFISDS